MKKSKTSRIAILFLALAMASMMLVAGTYAKYTSSATGEDSIAVAKWDIKLNGTQIAKKTATTVNIDLFDTILDTNGGAEETDVDETQKDASNNSVKLIAPGTKGSFALAVLNESEVNATYSINLTMTNSSNIPVEFSTDGTNWSTTIANANVSNKAIAMKSTTADTTTIQWRWVYEKGTGDTLTANDATDTGLGIDAQTSRPQITVTAEIVATQVD